MPTIYVNDYQEVDVKFDKALQEDLIRQMERKAERNGFTKKDITKVKKAMEVLTDVKFSLDGYIDNMYVSEDSIYEDGNEETYDKGYAQAIEDVNNRKEAVKQKYSMLFYKLEKLAYGFGNTTPLTSDELKDIKYLLDYEYKGM